MLKNIFNFFISYLLLIIIRYDEVLICHFFMELVIIFFYSFWLKKKNW